jgi:hypothetical protein
MSSGALSAACAKAAGPSPSSPSDHLEHEACKLCGIVIDLILKARLDNDDDDDDDAYLASTIVGAFVAEGKMQYNNNDLETTRTSPTLLEQVFFVSYQVC